jgi:4-carboxymuconolactone decarboxylase
MPSRRLTPVAPPYTPEVAQAFAQLRRPEPIRLFRILAHNPRVLQKNMASHLLDRGSITRQERELVILRTCARCGSEYEWGVHVASFAHRVGLTDAHIAATIHATADDAVWSPLEALLIRLVDELHDTCQITDALWEALAQHWTPAQLVELMVLIGRYHTVAFLTNGAQIEREAFAPRFPAA